MCKKTKKSDTILDYFILHIQSGTTLFQNISRIQSFFAYPLACIQFQVLSLYIQNSAHSPP